MLTAGPRATIRAAQPRRPADRARRSVHDRVRHLGRAQLPRRVRRRGRRRSCPTGSATTSSGSSAPYFEAVAEWYGALHVGQTGGALQADRRPPPRRPVLRHLPQPRPPAPPRRVGELAGVRRLDDRAALRDGAPGATSSRRPARPTSRPTSRTASRSPTSRCAPTFAARTRRRGQRIQARRRVHDRRRSASTCTRTCCRSRTSPAYLPPFLLRPDRAMTLAR